MRIKDLKRVMDIAHTIKRVDNNNIWSLCLKMAWAIFKDTLGREEVTCLEASRDLEAITGSRVMALTYVPIIDDYDNNYEIYNQCILCKNKELQDKLNFYYYTHIVTDLRCESDSLYRTQYMIFIGEIVVKENNLASDFKGYTTKIKDWFRVNLTQNERYIIDNAILLNEVEFVKRTEKAVQLKFNNDKYGYLIKWIPLSALYTVDEINKAQQAVSNGLNYNLKLIEFAKAHNIKGIRKGMRTQTILLKIQQAGLEAPSR